MKTLFKERYFNKKKAVLFIIFFISLFICFLYFSDLLYFLFQFDVNSPTISGNGEEVRNQLMMNRLHIHSFMNQEICSGYILPLIIFSLSIFFFQEKKSVFVYKYTRGKSQKKVILSTMLSHSLFAAVILFGVYMLYLTIGWFCMDITPSQLPMNQFDGIFGSGWGYSHNYMFYTICGIYRVFLYSLVYGILSCSICLAAKKAYSAIIWGSVYYYGVMLVSSYLPFSFEIKRIINPEMVHGFTSFVYDPVYAYDAFAPAFALIPPLVISAILIIYTFTRSEKVEN